MGVGYAKIVVDIIQIGIIIVEDVGPKSGARKDTKREESTDKGVSGKRFYIAAYVSLRYFSQCKAYY